MYRNSLQIHSSLFSRHVSPDSRTTYLQSPEAPLHRISLISSLHFTLQISPCNRLVIFRDPPVTLRRRFSADQLNANQRSASQTRVNLYTAVQLSTSVRFSINHRSISPNRSKVIKSNRSPISIPKKTCTCSPTLHLGIGSAAWRESGSSEH
jgi:hypothetical protein